MITINSAPTSSVGYSRWWQFSTLHPLLGGKFVATFQDNAIFVLDPLNGVVVGAAVLKNAIKSISTSGGFLYILCDAKSKAIVRVAVHHSFVTMESETQRYLHSNVSSPCISVNNSPMGSLESLTKDVDKKLTITDSLQSTRNCIKEDLSHDDFKPCNQQIDSHEDLALTTDSKLSHDIPTVCVTEPVERTLNYFKTNVSLCVEDPAEIEHLDEEDSTPLGVNSESTLLLTETTSTTPISVSTSNTTVDKSDMKQQENSESSYTGSEDIREHSRRVRMSQSAEDGIVAGSKSHRRRRKGKGKKISSATSN